MGGIQAAATAHTAHLTVEDAKIKTPDMEQLLYISTSMGLALLATAWTFFRVSGSVFNPNIALALLLTGAIKPMRFFLYVCAEILGAITASAILKAALPGKFSVNCSLAPGISPGQGVLIEGFITAALTLTVLFLAVEKHRSTPFAPCAIGLVLFATHLFGVVYTGAAMNSARAFGPDVVTEFSAHHWVYWVGPTIGAIIATLLYFFLKAVDLYALTPKQDSEEAEDSPDLGGLEVSVRRRNTLNPSGQSLGRSPSQNHPAKNSMESCAISVGGLKREGSYYHGQSMPRGNELVKNYQHHGMTSPTCHSVTFVEGHGGMKGGNSESGAPTEDFIGNSYLPTLSAKSSKKWNPPRPHQPDSYSENPSHIQARDGHKHEPDEFKEIPIWSPYLPHNQS